MIALAQTASGDNAGGFTQTVTITPGSNVTAGNFLIAFITNSATVVGSVSSVSDTLTNGWSKLDSVTAVSNDTEVWFAANITGGADVITVSSASFVNWSVVVYEYSGVALTSPIDVYVATSDGVGNFLQSHTSGTTGATGQANEVILGFYGCSNGTPGFALGSGYGNLTTSTSGSFLAAMGEDKLVSSTGTQTAAMATTAFTNGVAWCVTVKQAATTSSIATSMLMGV